MIIITGLGRCGTSILTKYLQEVGFELGRNINWHSQVRAGLELSTFYSIVDWMHHEYCKQGKKINLNDPCKCEYWNGYTYEEALNKVDKDERQGPVEIVKDPRITWNPDLIESIWKARKDIKLIICHRKIEDIYKSRKSLPKQYDDPKPRIELNEYKQDFADFYTKVLELRIPHINLFFPHFIKYFTMLYYSVNEFLPHDYDKGKEVLERIIDKDLLK